MAVRANLLEMNDIQNSIEQTKRLLETLKKLEKTQSLVKEEKNQVIEEKRRTEIHLQNQVKQLSTLEQQNIMHFVIYLGLFVFSILLHFGRYLFGLLAVKTLQEIAEGISAKDEQYTDWPPVMEEGTGDIEENGENPIKY